MDQPYINNRELRNFVETHSLRNRHSVIQFSAMVSIQTDLNSVREQLNVCIIFSGYENTGKLFFIGDNLDPKLFPTSFEGRYRNPTFTHLHKQTLLIKGTHPEPTIGQYNVSITPIARLEN